jgi:hypothetical protein
VPRGHRFALARSTSTLVAAAEHGTEIGREAVAWQALQSQCRRISFRPKEMQIVKKTGDNYEEESRGKLLTQARKVVENEEPKYSYIPPLLCKIF